MTAGAPPEPGPPLRAMPPAAMMAPPAQRWQCAICISARRAWEAGHQDEIRAAIEQGAEQQVPAASLLPPDLIRQMPPVMEAVTLAAISGLGSALVCAVHTPVLPDGSRRQLLVASAGLNLSDFAAGTR